MPQLSTEEESFDLRCLFVATRIREMRTRLYREIGLATVANEFEIQRNELDPELIEAIQRGERARTSLRLNPGPALYS
jgi:hypothetical protein